MVTKSELATETAKPVSSLKSNEGNFIKLEEKTYASHAEAFSKVEEWRKQHKIPKKESVDNLHKIRIRLRSNGKFDAVLYGKKLEKTAKGS